MIKLMLITNSPDVASFAESSDVDRIMIDLEILGKHERQGGLNTIISDHQVSDIPKVKSVLSRSQLVVRVNPLHAESKEEIDCVVDSGADLIMLPMFNHPNEVLSFLELLNGRVPSILLVETIQSAIRLPGILSLAGIHEVYFGLNDLRISTGLNFLFEAVSGRLVEHLGRLAREKNIPWGFGGIARIGTGELPAELVLAEHVRLGSSCVILSRAFHNNSLSIEDMNRSIDLPREVAKLREAEASLKLRTASDESRDLERLQTIVDSIVDKIRQKTVG